MTFPSDFEFHWRGLSRTLTDQASRQFGAIDAAGRFTPYDWGDTVFALTIAQGETPLLTLTTAGGHLTPRSAGWLDFAIPGPACVAAGVLPNETYVATITQIADGQAMPFARGTMMWESE